MVMMRRLRGQMRLRRMHRMLRATVRVRAYIRRPRLTMSLRLVGYLQAVLLSMRVTVL